VTTLNRIVLAEAELELIECDQGCPQTWVIHDPEAYDPPCPWCMATSFQQEHAGCEHARHGWWRRLRIVRRLMGRAYRDVLGLPVFQVADGAF
jgi:hypothetical protein